VKGARLLCLVFSGCLFAFPPPSSAKDPLPSWNDGAAKQAILSFVTTTTNPSNANFVPPEQRIATFDQDGTTWVEYPVYSQVIYCLDRVPVLVKTRPELAGVEPFKTVLSGDHSAIAKLSEQDLLKIVGATLSGMTVDEFESQVAAWLPTAKDGRWKAGLTLNLNFR